MDGIMYKDRVFAEKTTTITPCPVRLKWFNFTSMIAVK